MASRLAAAGRAYESATGKRANYGEMFRDRARQAKYYQNYMSGGGGLAAPPGRSRHEQGQATDVPRGGFRDWLAGGNADPYGLEFLKGRAYQQDPVHVQMNRDYRGAPYAGRDQPGGASPSRSDQIERARSVLNRNQSMKVEGSGKISVDVNAPKGTRVGAQGKGLFKDVEINRQTQMEPAKRGPEAATMTRRVRNDRHPGSAVGLARQAAAGIVWRRALSLREQLARERPAHRRARVSEEGPAVRRGHGPFATRLHGARLYHRVPERQRSRCAQAAQLLGSARRAAEAPRGGRADRAAAADTAAAAGELQPLPDGGRGPGWRPLHLRHDLFGSRPRSADRCTGRRHRRCRQQRGHRGRGRRRQRARDRHRARQCRSASAPSRSHRA